MTFFEPTATLLAATAGIALSGIPALFTRGRSVSQKLAAALTVIACLTGESAVLQLIGGAPAATYQIPWTLPFGPALFSVDLLSALFLFPLFLVTGSAAVYSVTYWPAHEKNSAGKLTFFLGLFAAAMVLVVLSRNGGLFLMVWEIMAIAAYFLLTTEQQDDEVQKVGTVYLLATHAGTMALFVLFSLLRGATGSFDFPGAQAVPASLASAPIIILAALVGFGGKAGLMPLHFWLPGAHANAPSHVSALMSGLMLKMGIYGILRTLSFFDGLSPWVGWLLLGLGCWSALSGISLASAQRDLKRLLACSSIENIGIIFVGIGMSLIGMQTGSLYLTIFGLLGAFTHIINHALFKSLLFLGSGVVIHATGTREIDRMGGLAKQMPVTSRLFLLGALAICGLPPLNGFIGELFLYFGAFTDGITSPIPLIAIVAPLLALVGGIAVITFVKLFGIVFLGSPRSPAAADGHEAGRGMTLPMGLLALACLLIGLLPTALLSIVSPVVAYYGRTPKETVSTFIDRVPLVPLTGVYLLFALLLVIIGLLYRRKITALPPVTGQTWGCGFLKPTPRMQYTGTSFSEFAVNLLGAMVDPRRCRPDLNDSIPQTRLSFSYRVTETVLDSVLRPIFYYSGLAFSRLRRLQHGKLHVYMLYIFATLFVLMVCTH